MMELLLVDARHNIARVQFKRAILWANVLRNDCDMSYAYSTYYIEVLFLHLFVFFWFVNGASFFAYCNAYRFQ